MEEVFKRQLEDLELEDKPLYKIKEVVSITGCSEVWVRRAVKQGARRGRKVEGVWFVPREEVIDWLLFEASKQERKLMRARNPELYKLMQRPSYKAHNFVRVRVERDEALSEAEREAFLKALDRYQEELEQEVLDNG